MSEPRNISTWKFLQFVGFMPDPEPSFSDVQPGLLYPFGNLVLRASVLLNRHFVKVVVLAGVHRTRDSIGEIRIEMPLDLASTEEGEAWIAHGLGGVRGTFRPRVPLLWLDTGRSHIHLLPAPIGSAAPKPVGMCLVDTEWIALAMRTLAKEVNKEGKDLVWFSFGGGILRMDYSYHIVPLPGSGAPWPGGFAVQEAELRSAPERFSAVYVHIAVYEDRLFIGDNEYEVVKRKSPPESMDD